MLSLLWVRNIERKMKFKRGTSHSYRGPQMKQLLPLLLFSRKLQKTIVFLASQKFKYLRTPVMNLNDFFFVVLR